MYDDNDYDNKLGHDILNYLSKNLKIKKKKKKKNKKKKKKIENYKLCSQLIAEQFKNFG